MKDLICTALRYLYLIKWAIGGPRGFLSGCYGSVIFPQTYLVELEVIQRTGYRAVQARGDEGPVVATFSFGTSG